MKSKKNSKVSIKYPETEEESSYIIIGLDLSLSRTGYAISKVDPNGEIERISIGSVKPGLASNPIWIRSVSIGLFINEEVSKLLEKYDPKNTKVIFCIEAPTPMNDFLTSLNRVVTSVIFNKDSILKRYHTRTLSVNASTLRSAIGLKKRGANNKVENIVAAYKFVKQSEFPGVDSDSCDAILLSQMGFYTSEILQNRFDSVPENVLNILCEDKQVLKGKGNNTRISTKGLLHNTIYWFKYEEKNYSLSVKDASIPKTKRLAKVSYNI